MAAPPPNIPSINITAASSSDNISTNTAFLSTPPSPSTSDCPSSSTYPPSPTPTAHSTNQPVDDKLRLDMLSPDNAESSRHKRKSSNSTMNSSITQTDVELLDMPKVNNSSTSLTDIDLQELPPDQPPDSGDNHNHKDRKSHEHELHGHENEDQGPEPAPFDFRPHKLAEMVEEKSAHILESFGGTPGLLRGLGTSAQHGLSTKSLTRSSTVKSSSSVPAENLPVITLTEPSGLVREPSSHDHPAYTASFEDRKRVYGLNVLPVRPSKSLLLLMWLALKDKVLILLSVAAVVSLALGLFQDFGTPRDPGEPPVEWVEGVAIIIAVAIVVLVGSLNDWQKERQFKVLNEKKDERGVKVVRDGLERLIDIKEVLVGDVALLEPGEIIPCDGVILSGHNVKIDESGATGESDAIGKITHGELLELSKASENPHLDCFVLSGSKVLEGVGRYVVVAVGTESFNGRILRALQGDMENTPLQIKLNHLAELIAKVGSAAGLLLFVALLIRFFVQIGKNEPVRTPSQKGLAFVDILIISVTLIVVAVPEGLPLAVTLALAFATKRMTREKLLVRVLGSCETMANASVVCTDKTGTLTQNMMTVVAGSAGVHAKFVRHLSDNEGRSNADGTHETRKHDEDFSIDQSDLNEVLSPQIRDLFNEAIAVNSTAFEDIDPETGESIFIGSKTEIALLEFAKGLGWAKFQETRENAEIIQLDPFSSERKAMGVVIKLAGGSYRFYAKGASEILLSHSTSHVVVNKDGKFGANGIIQTRAIDDAARENISDTIIFYANQSLRTIALCYREFASWPPAGSKMSDQHEVPWEDLVKDLTLIGITGIEDPLRPGVRESVAKCHRAGVTVKMCTGDNVLTARSIAQQCGIFSGGIIMEGPVFRRLSPPERIEIVPRLQVLARSSPEDKKILVETLKSIGEIVGVTGDGTNDGPALKTAHVGFSMGIAGTEVAKEASDIILMDDNFSSIVKAIMWGRCVNDAVRKFLQFQICANVTAVVITFVTAIASDQEESVLSAVQLLWINIIMDTFAALALATDPATEELLDRKPDRKTAPLFSTDMYKTIFSQSIYQIIVILIFHFRGHQILGIDRSEHGDAVVKTLVFNIFVFAQIFNSFNSRRLDRRLNVFEGIHRNYYFMVITVIEFAAQVLIVFVGGAAFQVTPLPGREWGISVALGFVSIPWGMVTRLLPNGPFEKVFKALGLFGKEKDVLPSSRPDSNVWNGAANMVKDNLSYFSNVRGGRMRASSFVGKSRSARLSSEKIPVTSMMTMVPTLIAGSIAARSNSSKDAADKDPSKSPAPLSNEEHEIHHDPLPRDDPADTRSNKSGDNVV